MEESLTLFLSWPGVSSQECQSEDNGCLEGNPDDIERGWWPSGLTVR